MIHGLEEQDWGVYTVWKEVDGGWQAAKHSSEIKSTIVSLSSLFFLVQGARVGE